MTLALIILIVWVVVLPATFLLLVTRARRPQRPRREARIYLTASEERWLRTGRWS